MGITQFYEDRLGAYLRNPRWSWGAVDSVRHRVYLRVWADQIRATPEGEEVQVDWLGGKQSPGLVERWRHLEAIRDGADGFGVVMQAADPRAKRRKMAAFDQQTLLRLGRIREDERGRYALITARVPLAELESVQSAQSTLVPDLRTLLGKAKDGATTQEALVQARVGQGAFRKAVLAAWNDRCAVTGSRTLDAVRASHIKPWRLSTDAERLDAENGLPLVASLDALFDAGLISFDARGLLLVSGRVDPAERVIFGLTGERRLLRAPSEKAQAYLALHRKDVYRA